VYVAGTGRAGTTLLERLLGLVPGVVPAGEVIDVWLRGPVRNERCGCGERFADCPFWSDVGAKAFGGWDPARAEALHAVQERAVRHFHPAWLTGNPPRGCAEDWDNLLDALASLYRALGDVSGARFVVDTSKRAAYASLLRRAGVDLTVVNLVRDPRAVAHSMTAKVERPHVPPEDGTDYMHTRRPSVAALEWVVFNEVNRLLAAKAIPLLRVRYEDLVGHPAETLMAILDHVGAEYDAAMLCERLQRSVDLGVSHGMSGNSMRFVTGSVELRADESWRQHMRRRDRMVTTMITAPLLRSYGYV
jgi:hypothetical protein